MDEREGNRQRKREGGGEKEEWEGGRGIKRGEGWSVGVIY